MGGSEQLARVSREAGQIRSLSRVLLTLDEVRVAGRSAFFVDYGETLLFADGELFDVRDVIGARTEGRRPSPLPAQVLESAVGIEYGWRHAAGCDCWACGERLGTAREHARRPVTPEIPAAPGLRASAARAAGSAQRR